MALPQSRDSLIDKRLTELEARVSTIEWRLPQVQLVAEPRQADALPPVTRAELWQGKPVAVTTTRGAELASGQRQRVVLVEPTGVQRVLRQEAAAEAAARKKSAEGDPQP